MLNPIYSDSKKWKHRKNQRILLKHAKKSVSEKRENSRDWPPRQVSSWALLHPLQVVYPLLRQRLLRFQSPRAAGQAADSRRLASLQVLLILLLRPLSHQLVSCHRAAEVGGLLEVLRKLMSLKRRLRRTGETTPANGSLQSAALRIFLLQAKAFQKAAGHLSHHHPQRPRQLRYFPIKLYLTCKRNQRRRQKPKRPTLREQVLLTLIQHLRKPHLYPVHLRPLHHLHSTHRHRHLRHPIASLCRTLVNSHRRHLLSLLPLLPALTHHLYHPHRRISDLRHPLRPQAGRLATEEGRGTDKPRIYT